MTLKNQRQPSVWPESESRFEIKNILLVSVLFHVLIGLIIWGASLLESEDVLVPVPPIMELVSAPPQPKVIQKKPEPKPPQEVQEPEPPEEITPEPELVKEPQVDPIEQKPEPKIEPKVDSPKEQKPDPEPDPPEESPQMEAPDFEDLPEPSDLPPAKIKVPQVDSRLNLFYAAVKRKIMMNYHPPKGIGVSYGTEFMFEITVLRGGGTAIGVSLKHSSGSKILDEIALRAIRLAQLPPIPPIFPKNETKLFILFKYEE